MRRKSDKAQSRVLLGFVILSALSSILASVIGYKAIRDLDAFGTLLDSMRPSSTKFRPEAF